jgi:molybdate transport system substrate-binding protein
MTRRLFLLFILAAGCQKPTPPAEPVTIFAAASAHAVLEPLAAQYESATGTPVRCQFGATSDLARQIEQGAPADLFLAADDVWVKRLEVGGLVRERADLLTNRLVCVVPTASALQLTALADLARPEVKRLALAGEGVPAGNYARAALTHAKVWDAVRGRVLEGSDVQAALAYVVRAEADAGLVYATDAQGRDTVRVAFTVPADSHPAIRYPLALLHDRPAVRAFRDHLRGAEARAAFERAGFGTLQ